MIAFEPGVTYQFTPCMTDAKPFFAVAAERTGREVEFVVPHDILSARPDVFEDRETIRVKMDGVAYFASAAAPAAIGASFKLLAQMREARRERV